ncbi:MAG: GNAT family N-acetyltransferase [Bacteroidetes bacterium]|nr:GNAT family N-acetyltransferase [Bacteroidota bacterium]
MNYTEKLPTPKEFFDLFETTGWNEKYQLSQEEYYTALQNSWYCISVYDNNQLVGFGRVICDSIVHALILDVIVHPNRQGEGIGKNIMDKLLTQCKKHQVRDIQLFSATNKAGFYEKLGFNRRKDSAPGMELKKYW